jgi:ClpP class serine protease
MISTVNSFLSEILCIERNAAISRLPFVVSVLKGNSFGADFSVQRAEARKIKVYQGGEMIANDMATIWNDLKGDNIIAVLSLDGVMSLGDQACGPVGMDSFSESINSLKKNPAISAIVIKTHSPGGEVMACFAINETIKEATKVKPVIAFVSGMAASAACIGLSGCSAVFASHEMCQIGSVGTISSILDFTEQLKKEGINLIEEYADDSTDKNVEYREAIKGNTKPLKERVNSFNAKVLEIVSTNRPNSDMAKWKTGKLFNATEALEVGLIDGIMSFDALIEQLSN